MTARRRNVPILRARGQRTDLQGSRPPALGAAQASPQGSGAAHADLDLAIAAAAAHLSSRPPPPTSGVTPMRAGSLGSPVDEPRVATPQRAPSTTLRPGWTDDLLLGNGRLDRQHKRFFLHALKLAVACEQDRGADEIEAALRFLREYASAHFADEERTMHEVAYPYLESHAEAHASFLLRLASLEQDLARAINPRALALDISYMAATWFAEHVRQVDRILARFLSLNEGT